MPLVIASRPIKRTIDRTPFIRKYEQSVLDLHRAVDAVLREEPEAVSRRTARRLCRLSVHAELLRGTVKGVEPVRENPVE